MCEFIGFSRRKRRYEGNKMNFEGAYSHSAWLLGKFFLYLFNEQLTRYY